MGSIACQQIEGGPLLISRPWYFVEIVDDQGRPVQPGESGAVLVTSTICRGTPFLRYRIGDAATFDNACCNESGISGLSRLDGRLAGILQLADGRRINNIVWNHLFKEFAEVEQFQVVVQKNGALRLRLKGAAHRPTDDSRLQQAISRLLRDNAFEITWVDQIPLTSRGKLLQVVQEGDLPPSTR
jgi:phenylacetate-CoA ligase